MARYVAWYWCVRTAGHGQTSCANPLLTPSPYAHCVLAPPDQPFAYECNGKLVSGQGSHCLLPSPLPVTLRDEADFVRVGITFKAGAHWALFGDSSRAARVPVVIEMALLQALDVDALLADSDWPQKIAEHLDRSLMPWLERPRRHHYLSIVLGAVDLIGETFGAVDKSQVSARLNCSVRTLERAMLKVLGITFRQYRSMIRMQGLVEHMQLQQQACNWTDMAFQFGFSDQPHMIRRMRGFVGCTPTDYQVRRHLVEDVYGHFSDR
ncbi:AraC family transcriptional regulator [Natronospirillum operosum]|uniref:AraC family transcriptional regulator n=1 Tax=Natronospirillum operosum TaxID=2759953 RepID=A0A4Z0WB25_9GAMM|nr:helix-turn-helix domain-containing protein [Natronospirillum operosum]TGG91660.1 AraC family transcriptional regulator [Natronospirillum operosum]